MRKPNLNPSSELAYIVGALLGDGYIIKQKKKGDYCVVLVNTNRIFVQNVAEALRKIGLNPFIVAFNPKKYGNRYGKKKQYILRAYSKIFVEWFENLTIEKLKKLLIENNIFIPFIRGFYEAEGSLKKRGDISISNTNKQLLELITLLLKKIGINTKVNGPYQFKGNRKPIYLIQTTPLKAKKFIEIVKPNIKIGGKTS